MILNRLRTGEFVIPPGISLKQVRIFCLLTASTTKPFSKVETECDYFIITPPGGKRKTNSAEKFKGPKLAASVISDELLSKSLESGFAKLLDEIHDDFRAEWQSIMDLVFPRWLAEAERGMYPIPIAIFDRMPRTPRLALKAHHTHNTCTRACARTRTHTLAH